MKTDFGAGFTVADARRYARGAFLKSAVLTAARIGFLLDTDLLLQHILGKPRAWLFTHDTADISEYYDAFVHAVGQRCTGLPVAYITGKKEFYGLPFSVTPDVLIPKPDTELLVERSISLIEKKLTEKTDGEPLTVLDPCTGSGCVVIAIVHRVLSAFPSAKSLLRCIASDISPVALAVAEKNAAELLPDSLNCISFVHGDMCNLSALQKQLPKNSRRFDIIAANPPYVPSAAAQHLLEDGRNEPLIALDGGADGLDFITHLANNAALLLKDGGVLLSEADTDNARRAAAVFKACGLCQVRLYQDLAGQDRMVEGRKSVQTSENQPEVRYDTNDRKSYTC